MHNSRNIFNVLVRIFIESRIFFAIIGHITFNSKMEYCAASSTVLSFPITSKHTIMTHSGMLGLILPGIIEEPGSTSGKMISAKPAFGPELRMLRLLAILCKFIASIFNEDENETKQL